MSDEATGARGVRIILCSTKPGDWICDPMAGSGTTLAVARRLGRNYVGIEEQGKFVEIINERLAGPLQQELL